MGRRHVEKLAILAKIESAYAVDNTPTGAANAILVKNVTIDPLLGTDISRDLLLPYLGHQGIILTGDHVKLTFDVEMAGAGAAGTAPGYGPLLRMAGLAETITGATKVEYTPISPSAFDSGVLYYFLDGVRHILLGARAKLTLPDLRSLGLGHFRFEVWGLLGTITDQSMPTQTLTAFLKPQPIGGALTTLALHGVTLPVEGLSIDFGNQVEPRFLINYDAIEIVDRKATGSAVVQADSMATKDWFAIAMATTTGALAFQHGTEAGKIIMIDAPAVQIGRPTQGATQKLLNYTLPLIFQPTSAGNDELKITVK